MTGSFEELRQRMVIEQLEARGITDPRVLAAFLKVPRHRFVPLELQEEAYADRPIPIGFGQTISQPYMVALMTQVLRLQGHERVLEIGTGSGYQAAILAELALEVFSVERIPELAAEAARRVQELGYWNVHLTTANGSLGWPEHAPYDGMLVAASCPSVPRELTEQLGEGGRLVIPLGSSQTQALTLLEQHGRTLHTTELTACVFVPLIGQRGWPSESEPGVSP